MELVQLLEKLPRVPLSRGFILRRVVYEGVVRVPGVGCLLEGKVLEGLVARRPLPPPGGNFMLKKLFAKAPLPSPAGEAAMCSLACCRPLPRSKFRVETGSPKPP